MKWLKNHSLIKLMKSKNRIFWNKKIIKKKKGKRLKLVGENISGCLIWWANRYTVQLLSKSQKECIQLGNKKKSNKKMEILSINFNSFLKDSSILIKMTWTPSKEEILKKIQHIIWDIVPLNQLNKNVANLFKNKKTKNWD